MATTGIKASPVVLLSCKKIKLISQPSKDLRQISCYFKRESLPNGYFPFPYNYEINQKVMYYGTCKEKLKNRKSSVHHQNTQAKDMTVYVACVAFLHVCTDPRYSRPTRT